MKHSNSGAGALFPVFAQWAPSPVPRGCRIGLLGGSFDPPHAGHVHVARQALRELDLDRVWWVVSPGNPLKPPPRASFEARMSACRRLVRGIPAITVTDIERRFGTRYSVDTLERIRRAAPAARFIWIMGADNLASIHGWKDWREIFLKMPVVVYARPGALCVAAAAPAARGFARARWPAARRRGLVKARPPAWTLIVGRMRSISSRALRSADAA